MIFFHAKFLTIHHHHEFSHSNRHLVGGLDRFLFFHSVGNGKIIPTDFHSIIFQRVGLNQQPDKILTIINHILTIINHILTIEIPLKSHEYPYVYQQPVHS